MYAAALFRSSRVKQGEARVKFVQSFSGNQKMKPRSTMSLLFVAGSLHWVDWVPHHADSYLLLGFIVNIIEVYAMLKCKYE